MNETNHLRELADRLGEINEVDDTPTSVVHVDLYSGFSEIVQTGDWMSDETQQSVASENYEKIQGNGTVVYKGDDDMFLVMY